MRIKVAKGQISSVPVLFYVVDGEPRESRVHITTDINAEVVERPGDSYIDALRRMLVACGAVTT